VFENFLLGCGMMIT